MTGRAFFLRWLSRSLRGSLASGAVATASLALAAALVFALATVSAGVRAQLGRELVAYGANLLVLPRSAPLRFGLGTLELGPVEEERALAEVDLVRLPGLPGSPVETVAPGLLARVEIGGRPAGAIGYPLDALRRLNPLWRVLPAWPGPGEAMAGASLADRLGLRAGAELEVAAAGRTARIRLAGLVETGGPEDENLFLPLEVVQALAGRPGQASLALVRTRVAAAAPDEAARAVEAAVPGAEARTLAQVAHAEASLLEKVTRLLALAALAIGAASAFTVSGTLGVLLLGRRREIGLCLALGAGEGRVSALLLAEAGALGLAGGLLGCLAGAAAAEAIALTVFGEVVPLAPWAAPLALAVAMILSLGAAAWPVRRAVSASPCDTLRAP